MRVVCQHELRYIKSGHKLLHELVMYNVDLEVSGAVWNARMDLDGMRRVDSKHSIHLVKHLIVYMRTSNA